MCKSENLASNEDKYFKRTTINKLKVRCSHKKSGCDWVGELGDLNLHSNSCPKRPWKCQHCDLETTYEIGTNDHAPNCTKYPTPCPNRCEIGTVPRCDIEKHLLVCPLQLVECEFASAGCNVKVPRVDMAKHMTENAQHHLMSTTLLNLRLTRELHQKMEEKDQQIADLQQQVNQVNTKIDKNISKIISRFDELSTVHGFISAEYTLTEFSKYQGADGPCKWYSNKVTYPSGPGYTFKVYIFIQQHTADVLHLSSYLCSNAWEVDDLLFSSVTARLQLLNQRGDHGHHMITGTTKYKKNGHDCDDQSDDDEPDDKLDPKHDDGDFSLSCFIGNFVIAETELIYNVEKNTEYVQNDSLKFRLYLKVDRMTEVEIQESDDEY